jgi:hypothetical protein
MPVGVVSSRTGPALYTGTPRASTATAGPGTGNVPCAESRTPEPRLTEEAVARSTPRRWQPSTVPITSTIESTTPISWNCTSEGLTRWAAPSARANRSKTSRLRSFTPAGSWLDAMIRWMRLSGIGERNPSRTTTSTFVAVRPPRIAGLHFKS